MAFFRGRYKRVVGFSQRDPERLETNQHHQATELGDELEKSVGPAGGNATVAGLDASYPEWVMGKRDR